VRVLYFSDKVTLVLAFALWAVFQLGATLICLHLPDRFLSLHKAFFRSYAFEQDGLLYARLFKVRRWKHLLPDGGTIWKKRGYAKRHLSDFSELNLERFLIESCRAELTHWLSIFPFWIFGFFMPAGAVPVMLLYALAVNAPCIIAQRYNRPRIERLLRKKAKIRRV